MQDHVGRKRASLSSRKSDLRIGQHSRSDHVTRKKGVLQLSEAPLKVGVPRLRFDPDPQACGQACESGASNRVTDEGEPGC